MLSVSRRLSSHAVTRPITTFRKDGKTLHLVHLPRWSSKDYYRKTLQLLGGKIDAKELDLVFLHGIRETLGERLNELSRISFLASTEGRQALTRARSVYTHSTEEHDKDSVRHLADLGIPSHEIKEFSMALADTAFTMPLILRWPHRCVPMDISREDVNDLQQAFHPWLYWEFRALTILDNAFTLMGLIDVGTSAFQCSEGGARSLRDVKVQAAVKARGVLPQSNASTPVKLFDSFDTASNAPVEAPKSSIIPGTPNQVGSTSVPARPQDRPARTEAVVDTIALPYPRPLIELMLPPLIKLGWSLTTEVHVPEHIPSEYHWWHDWEYAARCNEEAGEPDGSSVFPMLRLYRELEKGEIVPNVDSPLDVSTVCVPHGSCFFDFADDGSELWTPPPKDMNSERFAALLEHNAARSETAVGGSTKRPEGFLQLASTAAAVEQRDVAHTDAARLVESASRAVDGSASDGGRDLLSQLDAGLAWGAGGIFGGAQEDAAPSRRAEPMDAADLLRGGLVVRLPDETTDAATSGKDIGDVYEDLTKATAAANVDGGKGFDDVRRTTRTSAGRSAFTARARQAVQKQQQQHQQQTGTEASGRSARPTAPPASGADDDLVLDDLYSGAAAQGHKFPSSAV